MLQVIADMNGVVSVIEGQNSCRTGSEVGALTYSGILVDDFVPDKPGKPDISSAAIHCMH